jgi:uncharacterized protein (DUF1800 family)
MKPNTLDQTSQSVDATTMQPPAPLPRISHLSTDETGSDAWANDLTPIRKSDWNYARAAQLLERAGFGGTPEEIQRLATMTPEQAVEELVDYESIDVSGLPEFEQSGIYPHGYKYASILKVLEEARATGRSLGVSKKAAPPLDYQPPVDEFYTLLWSERGEMRRAAQWWAERMLITPRPLEENLALFWHNHFATSQEKVMCYGFMLGQIETLRRYANGNMRDLLIAIAQDPAMLIWLDNKDNVKGKPNENFAREVMELFSMGEGQGYTEQDIREMARAFTGWTLTSDETVAQPGRFIDDPEKHDEGTKSFLGATGNFTGYDAIDVILKQPAPPRFITRKLYRYFVREDMAPEVNEQLAKLLLESKYELKPMLKTIFLSRDFYSQRSQVKSPVALLVSTYRKMGLKSIPGIPDFDDTTTTLGQTLFFPPNVAGWAGGRTWINPATLLARCNCIESLLFPDAKHFVDPHKEISESFRRIPLKYADYNITGHVWNPATETMEPVSLAIYDRYLSGMTLEQAKQIPFMGDATAGPRPNPTGGLKEPPKSRMSAISNTERYNLAVGVYTGAWQGNARVKPIPRTLAQVDFTEMVQDARVETIDDTVTYFCRRFLSVSLSVERYAGVLSFLRGALKSDTLDYSNPDLEPALRRTVHLILSAPEYQLA